MTIAVFSHPVNGLREVDLGKARISRLRKRADAWTIGIWELSKRRDVTCWAIMLTYGEQKPLPGDANVTQSPWEPGQITAYQQALTKYYGEKLLAYLWVAERHKSGALHYHVCVILDTSAGPMLHADRNGWWPHGWSGTRKILHPSVSYLAKYLQKAQDSLGAFPGGMRLFAAVIRCEIPPVQRFWFRLSSVPGYVRRYVLSLLNGKLWDLAAFGLKWRAMPGGGWWLECNRFWKVVTSEWKLVSCDIDYFAHLTDDAENSFGSWQPEN